MLCNFQFITVILSLQRLLHPAVKITTILQGRTVGIVTTFNYALPCKEDMHEIRQRVFNIQIVKPNLTDAKATNPEAS